jgi:patched 1
MLCVSAPSLLPHLNYRAKGLQSTVQLMGQKDLYDYWSETYKVHTIDWSPQKAADILKEWTEKFSEEVAHVVKQAPIL